MKTKIVTDKHGVEIRVTEIASHADELMSAFKECQEGRCSCPTQEYDKLASLRVEQSLGGLNVSMKSKKGQKIDVDEIEKCLEHTKNRIK